MFLTNLGTELAKERIVQYKRMLKEWNCTRRGKKAKILKALEFGSTRLAYTVTSLVCRHGFILQLVRESSIITYLFAYRTAYFSYPTLLSSSFLLYSFLFTSPYSLLPFYWDKNNRNSLPSFFGRKYSKIFPDCVSAKLQSYLI